MKKFVCSVVDDFVYGGCLMRVDSTKIIIRLFAKKWLIMFERIDSISVFKRSLYIDIDYTDNHNNMMSIKILVLRRKKLLSLLEPKLDCIKYR